MNDESQMPGRGDILAAAGRDVNLNGCWRSPGKAARRLTFGPRRFPPTQSLGWGVAFFKV
jgi:hypothetical protein